MAMENTGIVYTYFLDFSRPGMHPFLDKRFRNRGYILDPTVQPHGGIYTMCQKVPGYPGAGRLVIQAPGSLAALGQIGINGPILEEIGTVMEYLAQFTGIDKLFGQGNRGNSAVIVPDRIFYPRFFYGINHRL